MSLVEGMSALISSNGDNLKRGSLDTERLINGDSRNLLVIGNDNSNTNERLM